MTADKENKPLKDDSRALSPACVNACPTDTLVFGDANNPESKLSKIRKKEFGKDGRAYKLLGNLGTEPNVTYLKKVDPSASAKEHTHA